MEVTTQQDALGVACEVRMLCKRPFVKDPRVKGKALFMSDEARQAATPFPCGQCLNCRINRSKVWVTRLVLEQMAHRESVFVTLTYNEENIPDYNELNPEDVTLFLKRIRERIKPEKIRYYYVGEYGEKFSRPHYHAALFGIGLDRDELIRKEWGLGIVHVGELNRYSMRYISGYVIKGMTGDKSKKYSNIKMYEYLRGRHPEFSRMSRRPGIGLKGMKLIAKKLKEAGHKGVVKEIKIGNKKVPLGRYLQGKLDEMMEYKGRKENDLHDYQDELFKELDEGCICLRDKIVEKFEGKRLSQEKRHKIYSKRRYLT